MPYILNPFTGQLDYYLSAGASIGAAVTGGTANSVLFVGPTGNLAQDNPNFTYNSSTKAFSLSGTSVNSSGSISTSNANNSGNLLVSTIFGVGVSGNGTTVLHPQGRFGWNSSGPTLGSTTLDAILTRKAAFTIQLGDADAVSPIAQTFSVQSVSAGTSNTAGPNRTYTGAQGTGTGNGGSHIFQVAPAGLTGSTQNPFINALIIGSTGKFTNYNNTTTAGWGVPAIYGAGRSVAQSAAVASVAAYTVGSADGSFSISANVNVTASATHSFTVTCTYTDETNTSRTLNLGFSQLTGTLLTAITNVQGTGAYSGISVQIRAKAATAITIATTGTFTSVTYNVEGYIAQIG